MSEQEDQARGGCDGRKLQKDTADSVLPAASVTTASTTSAHSTCNAISIMTVGCVRMGKREVVRGKFGGKSH